MQPTSKMPVLEPFLAEHPLFKGLEPRYQQMLIECASNLSLGAGQYLFHEGGPAERIYLIRNGKIAIRYSTPNHNKPITVQVLSEGDMLGWSWIVPPYRWHFDAVAIERAQVMAIDAHNLKRRCDEDNTLGYRLMSRVAEVLAVRLQAIRVQLSEACDG